MIRFGRASVREFAQFLFAAGDLYPATPQASVSAEEGIATQKSIQAQRAAEISDYFSEVGTRVEVRLAGTDWLFRGRADGCYTEPDGTLVIEEFKACRGFPDQPHSVDFGQALLYCGFFLLAGVGDKHVALNDFLNEGVQRLRIRLIYADVDSLQERVFEEHWSAGQLQHGLALLLLAAEVRLARHLRRIEQRIDWADSLKFPLPEYRLGQQAIARRVYRALKQDEQLLLEAPTGSGKSLAVLYPAVRAAEVDTQIFFLTSKNAGSQAAIRAARQLDGGTARLSAVEITAKQKVCLVAGMPCQPDQCKYARGYFDRNAAAVDEVVKTGVVTTEVLIQIAERHVVCPFELSLDASLWSDVIIGDYNYVFDPIVGLKRFSKHHRLNLLIDEAHQLGPRVQSMLEVELDRSVINAARQNAPSHLEKRFASIERAMAKILRTLGDGAHVVEGYDALDRAISKLMEMLSLHPDETLVEVEHQAAIYACHRWQQAKQWNQTEGFAHVVDVSRRQIVCRTICLDIGPWLQEVVSQHGVCIRFSATLTPLDVYQRIHGAKETHAERAPNPFRSEQTKILIIPDISTYYRARTSSLGRLSKLIADLSAARSGRYLVALPSYAYLDQLSEVLPQNLHVLKQHPRMTVEDTSSLLSQFAAAEPQILLIVMGGVLGESVDFSGLRLQGVFIVGIGLPPPSLDRDLMANYFDTQEDPEEENSGWGQRIAYTQPGLSKIQQAAGRLIRDHEDRGIICLIDPRFENADIKRFQPAHWRTEVVRAADAASMVTDFWQTPLPKDD